MYTCSVWNLLQSAPWVRNNSMYILYSGASTWNLVSVLRRCAVHVNINIIKRASLAQFIYCAAYSRRVPWQPHHRHYLRKAMPSGVCVVYAAMITVLEDLLPRMMGREKKMCVWQPGGDLLFDFHLIYSVKLVFGIVYIQFLYRALSRNDPKANPSLAHRINAYPNAATEHTIRNAAKTTRENQPSLIHLQYSCQCKLQSMLNIAMVYRQVSLTGWEEWELDPGVQAMAEFDNKHIVYKW